MISTRSICSDQLLFSCTTFFDSSYCATLQQLVESTIRDSENAAFIVRLSKQTFLASSDEMDSCVNVRSADCRGRQCSYTASRKRLISIITTFPWSFGH